jgi:hypothetical protein
MADFYTGLSNTANALLKDKGQSITVRRETESYDPVTAETVTTSSNEQTLNGAVFSKSETEYDHSLNEEKILGNTKTLLLSTVGSTFEPEINDKIIYGNKEWLTFGVSKLSPAGTNVIFKLGIMLLGDVVTTGITNGYLQPDGISFYINSVGDFYLSPTI